MFTKALLPDTIRAIQLVSTVPTVQRSYLAGGTALALHLGHRVSIDLDFFTQEPLDEKILLNDLLRLKEFKKEALAWRTVMGSVGKTKFSFFYYQYPLLAKTLPFEGIQLLDKPDIAAMKIQALGDRGTKRDFIDLYFLARDYGLDKMLEFYNQKYGDLKEKSYHLVRSMNYFADAEADEKKLEMLVPTPWEEVKKFFQKETLRLSRSLLGLKI